LGDGEVDQAGNDRRDGNHQAREVDLRDQILVSDQAVAGAVERVGEQQPGQQAAEIEQRLGGVVGGKVAQLGDDREDDHGAERLNDGPGDAKHGLLVANLDVAQGQDPQELAVLPQLLQVDRLPAVPRAQLDSPGGADG